MASQYRIYKDTISTYRDGVRLTFFVKDKKLTVTGFSGTEDIDWVNVEVYN